MNYEPELIAAVIEAYDKGENIYRFGGEVVTPVGKIKRKR